MSEKTEIKDEFLIERFVEYIENASDSIYYGNKKIKQYFSSLKDCIESNNRKEQVRLYHKLWPLLIRVGIRCLRGSDKRDLCISKSDLGIKDLEEYFKKFSEFEDLLFAADKFQRDHTIHVFRVFLLGNYIVNFLLNSKPEKIHNNFDIIRIFPIEKWSFLPCSELFLISSKEKEAIWVLISLSHDLGYPLEKLKKINDKLVEILQFYGTSNFTSLNYILPIQGHFLNNDILRFISSKLRVLNTNRSSSMGEESMIEIITEIQSKYYKKFSKSYERSSHGIISCILLMKNLTYFMESDYFYNSPLLLKPAFCKSVYLDNKKTLNLGRDLLLIEDIRQFQIRNTILRAIATHDCDELYHIRFDSFETLLVICDELQEWDRPYLEQQKFDIKNKTLLSLEIKERINKDKEEKKQSFEVFISLDYFLDKSYTVKDLVNTIYHKFSRYIRIFRSAVDSYKRNFSWCVTLTFNREEEVSNKKKWIKGATFNLEIPNLRKEDSSFFYSYDGANIEMKVIDAGKEKIICFTDNLCSSNKKEGVEYCSIEDFLNLKESFSPLFSKEAM